MHKHRESRGQVAVGLIGLVVIAVILGAFAGIIRRDAANARAALDDRFASRAQLTASFTRSYVSDLARRETAQAERLLAGPDANQLSFDQVAGAFDFDAAVLLDADGRLLQVHPAKPEILGKDMTVEYAHLRAGTAGRVGVSNVVPSAAVGEPIVAVAAPFDTPAGRRVLSGAFRPTNTALAPYFRSAVPTSGGNAFLVDGKHQLITSGDGTVAATPTLLASTDRITQRRVGGVGLTVSSFVVPDTPWRVVVVADSALLYQPVATQDRAAWALWSALAVVGVGVLLLGLRVNAARQQAATSALTDPLTGLANRRAILDVLARASRPSARALDVAALLLVDVDHFKAVNDRFGHDAGDEALCAVAAALRDGLREYDVAARWGGEEFLIVLSATPEESAHRVAERLRRAVAAIDLPFGDPPHRCTISIGVTELTGIDVTEALRAADRALYAAKRGGRDRVELAVRPAREPVALS